MCWVRAMLFTLVVGHFALETKILLCFAASKMDHKKKKKMKKGGTPGSNPHPPLIFSAKTVGYAKAKYRTTNISDLCQIHIMVEEVDYKYKTRQTLSDLSPNSTSRRPSLATVIRTTEQNSLRCASAAVKATSHFTVAPYNRN
jgi:hypothetical protein